MKKAKEMTLMEVCDSLNLVCSRLAVAAEAASNREQTNNQALADTLGVISDDVAQLVSALQNMDPRSQHEDAVFD